MWGKYNKGNEYGTTCPIFNECVENNGDIGKVTITSVVLNIMALIIIRAITAIILVVMEKLIMRSITAVILILT